MLTRNPAPENILPGDVIVIALEEEQYKDLLHSMFVVQEIDLSREGDRVVKLGFFDGSPVRHATDPTLDYWTRTTFVQVEKRTVDGQDVFYENNLSKTLDRSREDLLNWFFELD